MIRFLKFPRRRILAIAGSAAAIMLGGSLALGTAGASAQKVNAQQEESQNWSGYVVRSSSGRSFSSVSGSWVEPAVNSSSTGQGYASFWVGLGGASQQSQALEQVGTSAQVVGGQTTYSAWYELVPSAQVALPLAIHPGDQMTGKVTVNHTNVTISLSDQTTGKSVTRTLQMNNPDTSSAEWIAEAPAAEFPNGSTQILPLANFDKVRFTGASATAGGQTGSIADPAWTADRVDMNGGSSSQFVGGGAGAGPAGFGAAVSQQSTGGASAGGVSGNGTSFTVSYSSGAAAVQPAGSTAGAAGYPGYAYSGYGYSGYGYPGFGYPGYSYLH